MAQTRIDVAVADVHDSAANAAMRMLYVITQPGDNDDADALIVASLQDGGKVPARHVAGLAQHKAISILLQPDGSIYEPLRAAIRQAVKDHYLAISSPSRHYKMNLIAPGLG